MTPCRKFRYYNYQASLIFLVSGHAQHALHFGFSLTCAESVSGAGANEFVVIELAAALTLPIVESIG